RWENSSPTRLPPANEHRDGFIAAFVRIRSTCIGRRHNGEVPFGSHPYHREVQRIRAAMRKHAPARPRTLKDAPPERVVLSFESGVKFLERCRFEQAGIPSCLVGVPCG